MWNSLADVDRWPFAGIFQWTPSSTNGPHWMEVDEDRYNDDMREATEQSKLSEAERIRKVADEERKRKEAEEERRRRKEAEERERTLKNDQLIAEQLQKDENDRAAYRQSYTISPSEPVYYPSASDYEFTFTPPASLTNVASKSSTNRERLLAALTTAGYAYRDVGGGGDCLFLSLSEQSFGTPTHHLALRNAIVDEIEANREFYEEDVRAMMGRDDKGAFEDYCVRMRKEGECGDAICVTAFTRVFEADVVVMFFDAKKGELGRVVFEHSPEQESPIHHHHNTKPERSIVARAIRHIGWYPSESGQEAMNHYISVYPPDATTST
ncbi:hypothetical protein HDU93_000765 [Gonapodya sp. JEL0774]|nr:hypothetical protein HDU93_000765 [Gonapodya sp. JEL0774]